MRQSFIVAVGVGVFSLWSVEVTAQDMQAFHIENLSEDTTISLIVAASKASDDVNYDFDVNIRLEEREQEGRVLFVDEGIHHAQVRCAAPRKVLVGTKVRLLPAFPQGGDWRDDLWITLCLQPTS